VAHAVAANSKNGSTTCLIADCHGIILYDADQGSEVPGNVQADVKKVRNAAAVSILAVLAGACLGSAHRSPTTASHVEHTAFRIVYISDRFSGGTVVHHRSPPLTLRCSPAGGTLPEPKLACFAIGTDPSRYFGQPSGGCIGPALRWSVRITGTFRGQHIGQAYDMCNGQARAWTDLGGTDLVGIVSARSVVRVPAVTPGYVEPAVGALRADGLRVAIPSVPRIQGVDGSTNGYGVASQDPEPGARVPPGTLVVIRIAVSVNGGPGGLGPPGIAPHLTGIDVNRAISLATSHGLRVTVEPPEHIVGSLVVTGQSIPAGTPVATGDTVVLRIG
jgi:PASTA domain